MQYGLYVENPAPDFLDCVFQPESGDIFQMQVVQPSAAFQDGLGRIDIRARRVPDVDAKSYTGIVALNGFPNIIRRWKPLVLGPVIVNRQPDIELLDHPVQNRHRIGMWAANDGRQTYVTRILERGTDAC